MRAVSHPGIYIKDAIDELGLSQSEFAYRTGLSIKNVSTLINGESNITFDVALKLAGFFNNSVEGWVNLQTKYDLWKNEENKVEEYNRDWQIAKLFDKKFADKILGVNINAQEKEKSIDELRTSLNVSALYNLNHPDMYAFYKTSVNKNLTEKSIFLRNAWISTAEKLSRKIVTREFDKNKILENKKYLRSLTLLEPDEFCPKLYSFMKESGIKLVILPYLKDSNVSGVTKWISNENAVMVAVNDCGKDAGRIWFTIFHELGHAIKNHKRHMTISYDNGGAEDEEEQEANDFAKKLLIDKKDFDAFVAKGHFDAESIKRFAKEVGVADFIVLGRLQKEGYVPWSKYQDMKTKYIVDF